MSLQLVVKRAGQEVLSWSGRVLAYYFAVGAERGGSAGGSGSGSGSGSGDAPGGGAAISWAANCQPVALAGEPVHGGWSPWGPWTCSVPCGGGHGERTRTCTKPAPNILGRPCPGAAQGAARQQGPCSEWPCGQLSPAALQRQRARLQAAAHQRRAAPGDRVRLQCDQQALAVLADQAPAAAVIWIANGERALPQPGRV